MEFLNPNIPSKCLYNENKHRSNPHGEFFRKPEYQITPDILHVVGNTPLVKLNRIPQSLGIKCDVLAKCEFQNPGGSVKDRIAVAMIEDAETRGLLKPTSTIIEPTSGNAGIGLAMACAVKGYKCICVIPEKTSVEKENILQTLGAQIIRTPETPTDHPDGVFVVSEKLEKTIPDSVILRQFQNPTNPLAHYYGTAMEIFEQCNGQVDMVVMGVGSGGTMTGIGRKMKELLPNCLIVGVDPVGSFIAEPSSLNETDLEYTEIEGVGHNFHPRTLDKSVADFWIKIEDTVSFDMSRRLHREEGILCGSSTGCLMSGAMEAAKNLKEGQKCVVMFPDGVGNYLTKFVSDYWMETKKFLPCVNKFNHWWWDKKVSELSINSCCTVSVSMTCTQVAEILNTQKLDLVPCVGNDKILKGIVYAKDLINKLLNTTVTPTDSITKVLSQKYRTITLNSSLGELSHILQKEPVAVVVEEEISKSVIKLNGVLLAADLLYYITIKNAS